MEKKIEDEYRSHNNTNTKIATAAALGCSLLVGFLACSFANRVRSQLTFVPTRGKPALEPRHPEFSNLQIMTADAEVLHGWFIPHTGSSARTKFSHSRLILYFHGNGGNLGDYVGNMMELSHLGFAVVAIDYRGYGQSTGIPSEGGILRDAEAVLSYVEHTLGFPLDSVIVYGFSLGSVPATWLASRFAVGGLIVHNGFTTIWDVAQANKIPSALTLSLSSFMSTLFTPEVYIRGARCPVLIVHSVADDLCPFRLGEQLYRNVPHDRKRFVPLQGTHSTFTFSDFFRQSIKELFYKF